MRSGTNQHESSIARAMRRLYFPIATGLLLALTLLAFSDNLLTNVGQRSNADPKFIIHGLFCLAWMLLLAVQANLVQQRRLGLHRKLGVAGLVIAIGVTLSTLYVFVAVWKGWDAMAVWGKINRLLLPSYAVLVTFAFLARRRPEWHKRLIFVASLYMLEPVLSRSFDPFNPILDLFSEAQVDRVWWIYFILVWNGFFVSLIGYDWAVTRRVHPVTALGYLWFCVAWAIVWSV